MIGPPYNGSLSEPAEALPDGRGERYNGSPYKKGGVYLPVTTDSEKAYLLVIDDDP